MSTYNYRGVPLDALTGIYLKLGKVWSKEDTERFICVLKNNGDGTFSVGIARQAKDAPKASVVNTLRNKSLCGAILNFYRDHQSALRTLPPEVRESFKSIVVSAAEEASKA